LAVVCWLLYVLAVVALILLILPSDVKRNPVLCPVVFVLFVAPPAWVHYNWIHDPGYLFMSNGIRRLRYSDHVYAQVSKEGNRRNALGIPYLPSNLHTDAEGRAPERLESGTNAAGPVPVMWDDWSYVSTSILFRERPIPARTLPATLRLTTDTLIVAAGRWRPGIVLEVPYSAIVGVWNGADIATIGSGNVLVIVAAAGADELLFPLEVTRRGALPTRRAAVEQLVIDIEGRRRARGKREIAK